MKQCSIILTGLFMLASCGNAQAMQDFLGLQTKETALLDAVKKLTPEERAALEKVIELTRQEAKHEAKQEAKESVLSKLGSLARTVLESQSGSQPEEQPASQTTLKTIKDLWGTLMGPTEAPRA